MVMRKYFLRAKCQIRQFHALLAKKGGNKLVCKLIARGRPFSSQIIELAHVKGH